MHYTRSWTVYKSVLRVCSSCGGSPVLAPGRSSGASWLSFSTDVVDVFGMKEAMMNGQPQAPFKDIKLGKIGCSQSSPF